MYSVMDCVSIYAVRMRNPAISVPHSRVQVCVCWTVCWSIYFSLIGDAAAPLRTVVRIDP